MRGGGRWARVAMAAGWAGLALALAAPLAAHAYLGTFTRYMADDFCVAAVAQVRDFWAEQAFWYLNWSGRFAYTFAISLSLFFGPGEAAWQPALLLLAWTAALTFAVAGLPLAPDRRWRWGIALLLSLLLIGLTLAAIPNVTQSLYWHNTALTYQLPLVVGCLLVGVLLRARGWPWALWAGAIAFVGAGFAEIYSAMQTAALALALAVSLSRQWPARSRKLPASLPPIDARTFVLMAALAGSIAGLAVVALAPGTGARQETFAGPPSLWALAYNTPQYALWFLRDAARLHPAVWLAAIAGPALLAIGMARSGLAPVWPRRRLGAALLLIPVTAYALLVAAYAPAFYALQYLPPDRVLIIHWFSLLCLSALWGWLAGALAAHTRLGTAAASLPAPARAVLLAIGAALVITPSLVSATATLSQRPEAHSFATAWDAYDALLRAAAGTGSVTLTQLPNPGGIENFSPDPSHWPNRCAADYYGVEIRAEPPPPALTPAELSAMTPLDGQLGDVARVLGYRLDTGQIQSGGRLDVTLYWEPLALTARPLTVFVHLLHAQAGSVAQADAYPGAGQYPTTRWLLLRPFADVVTLTLRPDAPSGQALLIVGLYDLDTGKRLPATGAAANPNGEAWVELGRVEIAP